MTQGPDEDPNNSSPIWLAATESDFSEIEFEVPIAGNDSADCRELSEVFRSAAELVAGKDVEPGVAKKVFAMLAAVTSFYFQPTNVNAPYGPMLVMDGRRSAIPEDFRGAPVAALAIAAEKATNPVLKARLADVSWLLERKRHQLGRSAIAAYVAIVEGLGSGLLRERFDRNDPLLGLMSRDVLRRALSMGRALGWDCAEVLAARALVTAICQRATSGSNAVPVHWFFEIDLDFGVSAPSVVAANIEAYLSSGMPEPGSHMVVELWRLAARAHHYAKDDDGESRCKIAAAEALVVESEKHSSAMLASHWLSEAIAEYHGIPGQRDRRTQLKHRLVDVQAGIADEMSSFSHPTDLSDIASLVEKQMENGRDLRDLLLIFADLERSPSPEKLRAEAIQSISDHPLSSLFGATFHDRDGKVIHKSEGGDLNGDDNEDVIRVKIAQHESMRRGIHSNGQIEVARNYIINRYYVSEDTFQALLRSSPFVPHELLRTYSLGFARYFSGDFTSAIYILTPLLESSLRHVLKLNGHDVTKFDSNKQIQEDRTISSLLDQMRSELEETFGSAIIADIDNVFLSKPGPSLRHAVAHGLLSDGVSFSSDAIYACWLIFRLCCIPLFGQRGRIELPG